MKKIYALNVEDRPFEAQGDNSVNSAKFSGKTLHFPMGLGLILSAIESRLSFSITTFDNYIPGKTFSEIVDAVADGQPDYILLTGFLGNYQYRFIKRAISEVKQASPGSIVIIGGPMASCIPELLIDKTAVDYVVIGEGEETIVELLSILEEGKPASGCLGIAYRNLLGEPVVTEKRPRIKQLQDYPFPAYKLFKTDVYADYVRKTGRCWEISNSRGCYADCSYCRLTFGKKITFRPYDHILSELRFIIETYGISRFNFVDDNFLNSPRQVREFVDVLREFEHRIEFRFQGRADKLTPELATLLVSVGCFDISMGLESGSQRILDDMGKKLDVELAERNIKGILSLGISIHATFIVGMPNEDAESFKDTVGFIKRTQLPYVAAGILTPFPDTAIYDLAKERGLITDDDKYCSDLGRVYEYPYVNLSRFSDRQLIDWRDELDGYSRKSQMVLDAGYNRAA